jgi:hypothetical protein
VFSKLVFLSVLLTIGQPDAAPQQKGPETSPLLKKQVLAFEGSLRMAIERAGARLAQKAREVVPNVMLQFEADPIVSGLIVPEVGPHFDVQIPGIQPTAKQLFVSWRDLRKPAQADSGDPVKPVNQSSNKVGATGLPPADPMTESPTIGFDPDREYTTYVREELIDALLDYSTAIPIAPGERLTIVAKDILGLMPAQIAALNRMSSRQLILTIKGDDLLLFRTGKLTRDEAKQRIMDTRF